MLPAFGNSKSSSPPKQRVFPAVNIRKEFCGKMEVKRTSYFALAFELAEETA
jgi:hypothetical protein